MNKIASFGKYRQDLDWKSYWLMLSINKHSNVFLLIFPQHRMNHWPTVLPTITAVLLMQFHSLWWRLCAIIVSSFTDYINLSLSWVYACI